MCAQTRFLIVLIALSAIVACAPSNSQPGVGSSVNETPTLIRDAQLVGEPFLEPRFERVRADNCDGQSRFTRVERALAQGQTTFFQVEVTVGGLIKGAVIPKALEAELETKIQAALGRILSDTYQQSVMIELETQPGTAYQHTVTWHETKVKGIIEIVYPSGVGQIGFEKIIGLELGPRSSEPLSCPESPIFATNTPGSITTVPSSPLPPLPEIQATPTVTMQPATPSPTTQICEDISKYPGNFLSMERIPAGDSMTITVQNGEIHAVTAGTISVAGVSLRGGRDRGSVVILLPSATYTITELNPTWNWRGAFRLEPNEWNALAHVLAAQQRIPGTCSDPNGCNFVDVLVVGPDGIISQYEEKGPLAFDCSR
jgi:hypothetical protein